MNIKTLLDWQADDFLYLSSAIMISSIINPFFLHDSIIVTTIGYLSIKLAIGLIKHRLNKNKNN